MKLISLFLAFVLGGCSVFGYNGSTKEPGYSLVSAENPYEIRTYNEIVIATTSASGDFDTAQDETFERLFDYISGDNQKQENINMTAPVIMKDQGTEIPMTLPVIMAEKDKIWSMSFVLPENYTLETAPAPSDPLVKLETIPETKYAVIKFNGVLSVDNFSINKHKLDQWITAKNLKTTGVAMRAGYNPPWTLPPFRRNEVMIPVK